MAAPLRLGRNLKPMPSHATDRSCLLRMPHLFPARIVRFQENIAKLIVAEAVIFVGLIGIVSAIEVSVYGFRPTKSHHVATTNGAAVALEGNVHQRTGMRLGVRIRAVNDMPMKILPIAVGVRKKRFTAIPARGSFFHAYPFRFPSSAS